MKNKGNQKHLTFEQRVDIEKGLTENKSFTEIGRIIGKNPSTISKEVRLHAHTKERPDSGYTHPPCIHQSVIFCGQFIHAILFCSLLLRLLSFDFSLRIFLAQAGQYLDAPEPGTYSTPHTVQFLAGIAAHRFVGMICNSSTKPMNL